LVVSGALRLLAEGGGLSCGEACGVAVLAPGGVLGCDLVGGQGLDGGLAQAAADAPGGGGEPVGEVGEFGVDLGDPGRTWVAVTGPQLASPA